jgi:serine/threonine protein kinase
LLKTADHPNIVEMLGSYVMGDYQNILFREITGGDLGELLDGSQEHDFGSSQDFLNALAGLASAITTVHHLTPQNSRLIRNGFHHDLKPGNILVDGKNFILSDFGLARFKLSDETSETAQKPIGDFYLAPECIDLLDTSRTCFVRRSSDIWSFGCIIAEVLTYMIGGTSGVQNFKTARRYKIGHHVRYDFHSGPEPNSGVQKWLAGLKNQATVSSSEIDPTALTELVSLIEGILNPEPRSRPKAPAVEASLCLVALGAKVREIMRSYQDVLASELYRNSIEASIEAARFESIWWAIGLDTRVLPEANSGIAGEPETDFIVTQFGTLLRLLEREKGAFDVLRPFVETPTSPPFIEVKQSNKRILNLLPPALPEKVDAFLKLNLLQHQNSSFLQDIEDALREEPTNEKLLALVTMRKLDIILKENTHSTQCILDPKPKLDDDGIGDKRTGRLPQSATRVLVEFKSYRNWHDRESDVHQRVAAFVQRFSASDLPESLRTLRCIGFYHEPAENSLGIAYEFPSIRPEVRVTTLWQLLADDKAARDRKAAKERPSLRSRFDLGYRLASSVYELHSLHWLHKSISSFNIVFFTGPTSSIGQISQCIEQPYLVGFEHSRPDEERAFSSQLPKERLEYHHPDFINGSRYRSEFDYYSLGIVLLEIALWKSVSEITKGESWRLPWHAFRERLLVNVVPQVEFYVGPEYRDVVSELFRIGSYDDQREMIPTLLSRDFQHKVVSRLRRLNV